MGDGRDGMEGSHAEVAEKRDRSRLRPEATARQGGCGHLIGPRGLGPSQMPATVVPEEVGWRIVERIK